MFERPTWEQRFDLTTMAAHDSAATLWDNTTMRPVDVDMAQLYDGFSFLTVMWLEALGFCEHGRVGSSSRVDEDRPDGELPLNTSGGQLSGGRLHGMGFLHEACVQLWGGRRAPGAPHARGGGRRCRRRPGRRLDVGEQSVSDYQRPSLTAGAQSHTGIRAVLDRWARRAVADLPLPRDAGTTFTRRARCWRCRSSDVGPEPVSGRATVAAFTVNRQPGFRDSNRPTWWRSWELADEPDVRLITNVVGVGPEDMRVGIDVEVFFED